MLIEVTVPPKVQNLQNARLRVAAPIAQGIERRSPEAGAQVRILLGALVSKIIS